MKGLRAIVFLLMTCMFAGVSLTGCVGTASHPSDALREYVDDVRSKRVEDVYDYLGPDLHVQIGIESLSDFKTFFNDNYDEILAQAETIEASLDAEALDIVGALPVSERNEIQLAYEDGSWLLSDNMPAAAGADSPRGTLDALGEAMATRDYNRILSLMSSEKQDTLNAELNIILIGLQRAGEDDIVVNGDSATVYMDGGLKLELVREEGAWRIQRITQ